MKAYEACGVEVVEDLKDLPNIMSIATPDDQHYLNIMMGLGGPVDVFCEKPICLSQPQLSEIKNWLASTNLHFGTNYPLRHHQAFIDLKQRIEDGELGEIYRIDGAYHYGRVHKLRYGWRAVCPGYSMVLGGLIHIVDAVHFTTGLRFEPVSAIGVNKCAPEFQNHDTVASLCRLSNGGLAHLCVDGGVGVDKHQHVLRVYGTRCHASIVNEAPTDKQAAVKEFVRRIRVGEPPERDFSAMEACLKIEDLAHA